jgi:hypothetical protein
LHFEGKAEETVGRKSPVIKAEELPVVEEEAEENSALLVDSVGGDGRDLMLKSLDRHARNISILLLVNTALLVLIASFLLAK